MNSVALTSPAAHIGSSFSFFPRHPPPQSHSAGSVNCRRPSRNRVQQKAGSYDDESPRSAFHISHRELRCTRAGTAGREHNSADEKQAGGGPPTAPGAPEDSSEPRSL